MILSKQSLATLVGVHPDLVLVVKRAILITEIDFKVGEGLRTIERQRQLVHSGASMTMRSRHLTGHAVDLWALVGGQVRWDWPLYYSIRDAMQEAAKELRIPIESGADWTKFRDGPHHQLPWAKYP